MQILFNNAGIAVATEFGKVTQEELIGMFRVNTAGPFLVTQALYTRGLIGGEKETVVAAVSSVVSVGVCKSITPESYLMRRR